MIIAQQIQAAAEWIVRASWQAGVLVGIVLIVRAVMGSKIAPSWWCALWIVAGLRFVVPTVGVQGRLNVWNWMNGTAETNATGSASMNTPNVKNVVRVVYDGPPAGAPVAIAEPMQRPVRWRLWLSMTWAVGVVLMLGRRAWGEYRIGRAIRRMTHVVDDQALALLRDCANDLHILREVRAVQTSQVRSPAVWGSRRPILILPEGFVESASRCEMRMVFLHELIHVKRQDVLVDRIMGLVRDLHWFNPLAWFWVWIYRADRELACDRAVLQMVREPERDTYGQCLLMMVQRISGLRAEPATVGMFGSKKNLQRRITMISSFGDRCGRGWSAVGLMALIALGCAALTDGKKPAAEAGPNAAPQNAVPLAVQDGSKPSADDAAVRAVLDKKLPELRFDAVPFSDVADFMRDVSKANIFVNWKALEAAGIDRNAPVTARLRDISFKKALTTILNDVGGGTVKLGYTIDEGVLTISTEEDLDKSVVTRVYDIRDLIVEPASAAPPGEVAANRKDAPKPDLVTQLVQLIQETVAADSWREAGGTVGSIRELSGQLVVIQTPENQEQIAALLKTMRQTRGIQVNVEARFLTIDLKQCSEELKRKLEPALADTGSFFLSGAEADALQRETLKHKRSTLVTAPRLTLFNGQRAYVTVGTETPYISGFSATKKNGEMHYEPKMSTVTSGVLFEVTATASADRKFITMSLKPRLTHLLALRPEPWGGSVDAKELTVQRPSLAVQEASTTVSVPDGNVVIIATTPAQKPMYEIEGAKAPATNAAIDPDSDERLFVLVKPRLILQREQPKEKPAANEL